MTPSEVRLARVAARLSWLDPPPVFLGGATIGLYLDELGRSQLRPTDDVDCIVPLVRTWASWTRLEEDLRARGWSPDPGGPICRYASPDGDIVDLMPSEPAVLGFSGRWYAQA